MIDSYLQQLKKAAQRNSVELSAACEAAGVAKSTLWRWIYGASEPKLATTRTVERMINRMGNLGSFK